ncbi:hypothetical protein [Rummeliibacillus stabekisii]|uniref:hypothetical protein n=1 Tax=Rummeliibacillus stabekisii TaxID=241244 RepID=UPI003713FBA4
MKKLFVCVLLFSLLFPPSLSYAKDNDKEKVNNTCSSFMSGDKEKAIKKYQEDDASLQESYAIDLVQAIFNSVNINTLNTLVFGNPYCVWYDDYKGGDLVYGVFTKEQKAKIVDPVFKTFTSSYMFILLLVIMISGIKMAYQSVEKSKMLAANLFSKILLSIVLIVGYSVFVGYIFDINAAIVKDLKGLLESQGLDLKSSYIVANQDDFNFTDILIIGAEWMLVLFLNFVYIMRTFMITVLMATGGLAIVSILFDSSKKMFSAWLQDFLGAIFMQSIHALYFTIVLLFVSTLGGESAVFFKLILLALFLPLSSMVMGWLNLSSSSIASSTGMTGINSINTMMNMASKVKRAKSKKIPGKNNGMDLSQIGKTRISSTGSGLDSSKWISAKSIMAKSGVVVGATAGSVLGPAGAQMGGRIGGAVAPALLQTPRNVAGGVKGVVDTVKTAKKEGFNNIGQDINKKRKLYGDLGESLGTMIGAGSIGRSVGNSLSGVSRQRLLNSKENGGFGGVTLDTLASKYPGANVSFMQTNEGSGFYLNKDGSMVPISPMGAADTNLKNGEARMVDYQFADKTSLQKDNLGNYFGTFNNDNSSPLIRTSEAYINAGENKYIDKRFNAHSINPSDFYRSGMQNAEQRNTSDRVADKLSGKRHPGFV